MPADRGTRLEPVLLDADALDRLGDVRPQNLAFHVVDRAGAWLDATYDLLSTQFARELLDPPERYREWLALDLSGTHQVAPLLVAAYVSDGDRARIVGAISGTIMRLPAGTEGSAVPYVCAINHQVTASVVRQRGIKGIGTRLLEAGLEEAHRRVGGGAGELLYSVLEADVPSLGFWDRMGYRWPRGMRYWQPPLEFDAAGDYVHPEVPAILMLRPQRGQPDSQISRATLEQIVKTRYETWSLAKYRGSLAERALERAEQYVLGRLFERVLAKMPDADPAPLVRIRLDAGEGAARHVRSVALSQGIQHGLEPLHAFRSTDVRDFDELLQAMKATAFGARTLGEAADVLYAMATDRDCRVILTLAGAVSVAKLDLLLAELVERRLVHGIVTTGAIICHGFNAERGSAHFKVPIDRTDTWLFEQGYNRIYDTIETEYALDELQDILHHLLAGVDPARAVCSSDLVRMLGQQLVDNGMPDGLLQSAYRRNVPIFIPAFTDSELGLDFALFNHYRREAGGPEVRFDPFADFERYREFATGSDVRGILTLGGGVPRNWAQQIGPYLDAIERHKNAVAIKSARFKYGVRICPDPPYWGGLSGCTYSEGISWGKFVPSDEGGMVAEVLADFTFVFPLLVKGLFERLAKGQGRA